MIGFRLLLAAPLLACLALTGALPESAAAAEVECPAASVFSGIRPPARYGNEEVAVAPWEGGLLFWSRDARYRFDTAAGVALTYRDGRQCRVALSAETATVARLPVAGGQAALIRARLCPVEAETGGCLVSDLQFLPR